MGGAFPLGLRSRSVGCGFCELACLLPPLQPGISRAAQAATTSVKHTRVGFANSIKLCYFQARAGQAAWY
jgi:hypothetical protein